jgi:hypothetical protein
MILDFVDETTGTVLDRVDITTDGLSYDTGAAESTVQGKIDTYGRATAMVVLRSWSNGYVSTREIKSPAKR